MLPPPSASPVVPQMISMEQTPLLGFEAGRTLQDTLRRASEYTPQGMRSPETPMRLMTSAGNVPSRFNERDPFMRSTPDEVPATTPIVDTFINPQRVSHQQYGAMGLMQNTADEGESGDCEPEAREERPAKGKGKEKSSDYMHPGQCSGSRGNIKSSHEGRIEKRLEKTPTESLHISYILSPTKASYFPDPKTSIPRMPGQEPATYSFQAGQLTLEPPYGNSIRDEVLVTHYSSAPTTTIEDVLASAEAIRDVSKRIESVLKDYRSSLKMDGKELKRSDKDVQKERATIEATEDEVLPAEEDQAIVKAKLLKGQRRYGEHIELLFDDLRKLEYDYRRNLERFNRQADDPILDPLADIPVDPAERTEEEEVTYRGRVFILAKLEKRGYKGGPVARFLENLDAEEWKDEMREVILMSDARVLQAIQDLAAQNPGGPIPDIDFDGIDLTDLATLPWGHFKLTGQDDASAQHGKENTGPAHDMVSPTLPSESGDEEELERSYLSDPGITPALKSRLQRVRDYDRL
ncbi:hypothetical protein TWF696_003730 [Orbilia brochopaga]|uniref:Uncharacterized protein n=1 Tax=Orbilia brochopaga TaxID=3140254 RepID=A0AAV9V4A9_9PEZI